MAIYQFYPAHVSNYTKGRRGKSVRYITFHHTAANNTTLRDLWGNPSRNGSSHYFVGTDRIEQYVDEANTAWTNGVFASNLESVTIETNGDWRFGYRNEATLNNLVELVRDLRKRYPGISYQIHRQVFSGTVCPGDLPVEEVWQRSEPQAAVLRRDIADKKVALVRDTNVWDMSFTKYSNAKAVAALPAGTVIDVAGIYDHPLGTSYYLSNYSWERGLNNGINVKDTIDYVPPAPEPAPVPVPVEPPVEEPPVVQPPPEETPPPVDKDTGSGTLPPIPVDPNGDDIKEILGIVRKIWAFISSIIRS